MNLNFARLTKLLPFGTRQSKANEATTPVSTIRLRVLDQDGSRMAHTKVALHTQSGAILETVTDTWGVLQITEGLAAKFVGQSVTIEIDDIEVAAIDIPNTLPTRRNGTFTFGIAAGNQESTPGTDIGSDYDEVGEVADEEEPFQQPPRTARQKPSVSRFIPKLRLNRSTVRAGLLVLAALIFLAFVLTLTSAPAKPIVREFQAAPEIVAAPQNPLDVSSAASFDQIQIVLILSYVLLVYTLYQDARERNQMMDAHTATISVLVVLVGGWVWNSLLRDYVVFKYGFDEAQMVMVSGMVSALVLLPAMAFVISVSIQGGRDWTPSAAALALLAGGALLFNTLGVVETLFKIPESPVFSFAEIASHLQQKQYQGVWMSVATYLILLGALVLFIRENTRAVRKLPTLDDQLRYMVRSATGIVAYVVLRILSTMDIPYIEGASPVLLFAIAVGVAALAGLRTERGGQESAPEATGELRLQTRYFVPWDRLSVQLVSGIFLVVMFGRV